VRSKMVTSVVCVVLFISTCLQAESKQAGLLVPGSQNSGIASGQIRPLPGEPPEPEDEQHARAEKDMAKRANKERQAQLKRDTERLVKLASELQGYVDKSNEGILSLDVVKKAEEIEKLAHSVKEKMKGQ
jgi:hypothetical protein